MIGANYWSTGITIEKKDTYWNVSLDFLDDGWMNDNATQGTLRCRYLAHNLSEAVDVLKADAEKLGIEWKNPSIYYPGDGEWGDVEYPVDWRNIVNREAARLGWVGVYAKEGT